MPVIVDPNPRECLKCTVVRCHQQFPYIHVCIHIVWFVICHRERNIEDLTLSQDETALGLL
jgi:hypothetical protein